MDEEYCAFDTGLAPESISVCKCLIDQNSSEEIVISERKQHILTAVARTENYLKERRIPELIRYLLTKILAEGSNKPMLYFEKLLNDCMLYRSGNGSAPVLYEKRHLEAIIKSFDPGQRGWLSAGQVRRAYVTLGLAPEDNLEDRIPSNVVLNKLQEAQESDLYDLLTAGMNTKSHNSDSSKSNSSI